MSEREMKLKPRINLTDRNLIFGFSFVILLLICIGFYGLNSMELMIDLTQRRAYAREGARNLEAAISLLKDAETGQRGYILTQDPKYLKPYKDSILQINEKFGQLPKYFDSDPNQRERLNRILELRDQKISEIESTIRLQSLGRHQDAVRAVKSDRARDIMMEIRKNFQEISSLQNQTIRSLNDNVSIISQRTRVIVFVGNIFSVILAAIALILVVRNQKRRELAEFDRAKLDVKLQEQKNQLNRIVQAQYEIATVGLDTQKIMSLITKHSERLTGADGAVIELIEGDEVVYHYGTGTATKFAGMRIKQTGSFSGLAIKDRRLYLCKDSELDDRVNREACRKAGVRSMIVMPLIHHDEPIGVLKVFSAEKDRFGEEQSKTLQLIGSLLASTLGQATEYEEKHQALEALRLAEQALIGAKESAENAAHAKSILLANVSHEVRTPINGVLGMSGILMDTELTREQREYVRAIHQSGESLLSIVNDILDLSKAESGKLQFEEIDFDVRTLLKDLSLSFEPIATSKGIVLRQEIPDAFPVMVKGDPGRFRQVLTNLIGNAMKFTHSGEIIVRASTISCDDGNLKLSFEIQDSGIGMSEDTLRSLFQPFMQADVSTTRKYGGTGLGLSITKRLIELMHGSIRVKSALGHGSTFQFSVRIKMSDAKIEREQDQEKILYPKGLRALIVEDNIINQKVALKQLEKIGFRCDVAANGLEALDAVRKFPYSVVFMDCQMPEMDGYTATRKIREEERFKKLTIIAMTANAIVGEYERCIEAGMNDYVHKPIRLSSLVKILNKWLGDEKTESQGEKMHDEHDLKIKTALDPNVIADLRALDPELITELGELFLNSCPSKLDSLQRAIRENDFSLVSKISHQAKSSCGNLGAMRLSRLFETLEEVSDQPRATELIEEIKKEYELVSAELVSEMGSKKAA